MNGINRFCFPIEGRFPELLIFTAKNQQPFLLESEKHGKLPVGAASSREIYWFGEGYFVAGSRSYMNAEM